jgi:hypothetical protein
MTIRRLLRRIFTPKKMRVEDDKLFQAHWRKEKQLFEIAMCETAVRINARRQAFSNATGKTKSGTDSRVSVGKTRTPLAFVG